MSETAHDGERATGKPDPDTGKPDTGKPSGGTPGAQPENWLTAVVLLILRDWSSYGYDLMRRLAAFGFAAMNYGTLYRVLRQLEKDGMVSSAWDTSKGGPARRIYAITESGEAYLKLWANSLEQYRTMMESFFKLYGVVPPRADTARDTAKPESQ